MWSDILGVFYHHLEQVERDLIAQFIAEDFSFAEIARILGRSGSTISREFRRNKLDNANYFPSDAHERALERKSQSSIRVSKCEPHSNRIRYLLGIGWTPEQIASDLEKNNPNFSVSYETIYCFIYKKPVEWCKLLPRKHEPRWLKRMGRKQSKRDMIPNRTCISKRTSKINDKTEFGHWEGDSIVCSQSVESLNVMVERQTQYVSIRKVFDRGPSETKDAMIGSLSRFKKSARKSITMDNGIEFKFHEKMKDKLKIDTYFCHPYSSWEKGLVEQVNGLIRRFLPKKTNLAEVNERDISLIEYLLNSRPRKLLNFATPAEVFAKKSRMKLVDGALAT